MTTIKEAVENAAKVDKLSREEIEELFFEALDDSFPPDDDPTNP